MVGMRKFYLIFPFFSFCRRIYLEVYVDACLVLLDRYCHFNYCIHYFAMWIEYGWLLLSTHDCLIIKKLTELKCSASFINSIN